ncbi:MAG: hypothetical protein U5L45_06335 [Saprospiraceae bacterium]|nr:hypothetical protein [Saprospiraceae bacterium]
MRFTTTQFSLILILLSVFFTPAFAVISTRQTAPALSSMTQPQTQAMTSQKLNRTQKKTLKIEDFLRKKGIDLTHPTDKWLWFGLGLLGLAAVMTVLPLIRLLAGLVALVGVVFIFIWFFKKLA